MILNMPSIQLRRNVISQETKDKMIQDYIDGVPVEKITTTHNVSKPTLYRYLKNEGVDRKDEHGVQEES